MLHSSNHLGHGGAVQPELHRVVDEALFHQGEKVTMGSEETSIELSQHGSGGGQGGAGEEEGLNGSLVPTFFRQPAL